MNYTFNQLKIFRAVAQESSITRAAEKLHLTQPAVSIQLKKLQNQFEIPLTETLGRRIFITEFGKSIAAVCDLLLEDTELIEQTISKYKGVLLGKIRLSIVSTAKYVMPYFLEGFMKKYPEIEIEIDVTNKGKVVKSLEDNQCDFAMVSVLPTSINLNTIPLLKNELHLVCSPKNQLQVKDFRELKNETLILREEGSATRMAMKEYLDKNNITKYKKMVLESNEAVKQAVLAGLGYSIMPIIGLRTEIKLKNIAVVKANGLPITTMWNLVYDRQKRLSPAALALVTYIQKNKEDIIQENFNLSHIDLSLTKAK